MTEEYTGGSVSYYRVNVEKPTSDDIQPYQAECNDIIEALGMNYAEGNALKALWRRAAARNLGMTKKGYKDGLYDAEKVVFFGQRLVAQESALKAEALSEQRNVFSEIMEGIQEMKECRENNGGKPVATAEDLMMGGETLSKHKDGKPSWKDAPYWAEWLAYDKQWTWFYSKPIISPQGDLIPTPGKWENTNIEDSFGYSIHYMEPRPDQNEEWIRVFGHGSPFDSIPDYDFDVLHHDGSVTYGIHRENAVLSSHGKQGYWLWLAPAGNSIVAYRRSKERRP